MMTLAVPLLTAALVFVFASSPSFISTAMAADDSSTSRNQDMAVAEEEMQRANYFAYVMLINMVPPNLFPGNVTFLMPNDKTLAKNKLFGSQKNSVADFLLRHSIPSPLRLEQLQHIPTGSMLPTSKPELLLKITNKGRRNFFLNNVRIISPDICTLGGSIRCHGIDGIIQNEFLRPPATADECPNYYNRTSTSPGPQSAPSRTDYKNDSNNTASPPPAATNNHKSASSTLGMSYLVVCLTLLWMKLCV